MSPRKQESLVSATRNAFPDLASDEVYAAILCGEVFVDGERNRDPHSRIPSAAVVTRQKPRYVSRGGVKLEHALDCLRIDVSGKVMIDAGASTGGFTDCLLQHGAAHVHAVDVGYNQLAYVLRRDPRVSVHERTNISDLRQVTPPADAAVADLSFRSISGAASRLLELSSERWAVVLVKPQFEQHERDPEFTGVVRNAAKRRSVLTKVVELLWMEKAYPVSIVPSPILGRRGNREYFLLLRDYAEISKTELANLIETLD